MAKLQGLLFGLATLVLVVVATFYFTKTWLPPLKSDRIAIDHAPGDHARGHGARLHRHQPDAGLVRVRATRTARARAPPTGTTARGWR